MSLVSFIRYHHEAVKRRHDTGKIPITKNAVVAPRPREGREDASSYLSIIYKLCPTSSGFIKKNF